MTQPPTLPADALSAGVWVVLPTYNEADNLPSISGAILHWLPQATLLVVDDGSPDGTGHLADRLTNDEPRLRVRHRRAKEGLGKAYLDGFRVALDGGALVVVQMDADWSHDPAILPGLIAPIVDGSGREVTLAAPARRVVSLIPSATDILVALGAVDRIVGRTNYDIDSVVAHVPSVGGGLDPSVEAIAGLRPDLVVMWHGSATERVAEQIAASGVPVYRIGTTEDTADVYEGIEELGALTDRRAEASALIEKIRGDLAEVRRSVEGRAPRRIFYVAETEPPMTVGPNTFVGQLISIAGGESVFPELRDWPRVDFEQIVRRDPDLVVVPTGDLAGWTPERLASRGGWREVRAVREGRVATVPANLVNRPGPNLAEAARALRDAMHPDLK